MTYTAMTKVFRPCTLRVSIGS